MRRTLWLTACGISWGAVAACSSAAAGTGTTATGDQGLVDAGDATTFPPSTSTGDVTSDASAVAAEASHPSEDAGTPVLVDDASTPPNDPPVAPILSDYDAADPCEPGTYVECGGASKTGVGACESTAQGFVYVCDGAFDAGPCTLDDGGFGASTPGTGCLPLDGCDPSGTHLAGSTWLPYPVDCEELCAVVDGAWTYEEFVEECGTPLVLAFDDEPVVFTRASGSFDVMGRAASIDTDWVSASTPWLAIDLDGNGAIDDGRELFGSMTVLPNGERAKNGFEALASLDANGDGRITRDDPAFARLLVWRDVDQDRASESRELRAASDEGLVAIDLDYGVSPRCVSGSCEVERARFVWRDAAWATRTGAVVDVHLAAR